MRTLARWLGKTAFVVVLLYAFMVLACALWLRGRLNPTVIAQGVTCWTTYCGHTNGPEKYRNYPWMRDWLVVRTVVPRAAAVPAIGWHVRNFALYHVYSTYWPAAERARLFEDVVSKMRPCGSRPPV